MPYFEFHDSAPDHPKVRKLAKRLSIEGVQALGHMASLWAWTLRMAPDGDLGAYDHESIEIGAQWGGEEGAFVRAALDVGLLDEGPRVHDWTYYAGSWKSAAKAKAWREQRAANVRERSGTRGEVGEPYRTGTNDRPKEQTTERASFPSLACLPLRDGSTYQVPPELISKLRSLFPSVSLEVELAKAEAWAEGAPVKDRWTRRGVAKGVVSWFQRASNDARARSKGSLGPGESREIVNYREVGDE